jgi:hypothetical protein
MGASATPWYNEQRVSGYNLKITINKEQKAVHYKSSALLFLDEK